MAAGTRVGGDGYCSATSIEIVVRGGQPEAFKSVFDFPFLADAFLHADPELHKIPATHLIGETELVVAGRIELVKSVPVPACRIFRSRGVVTLDKDPRRCGNFRKGLAHAGKTKVPRRKAPENIRLEGRTRNDVMETSVNSVEIVTGNCAV